MRSNYWYGRLSRHWQRFLNNPYSHLLWSLILLFVSFAVLDSNSQWQQISLMSIFFVTVLFVIETFKLPKKFITPFRAIAALGYLFNLLGIMRDIEQRSLFYLLGESIQLIFMGISVVLIIKRIFADNNVTGDTLRGGISAYLMLGIVWYQIYNIILSLNPQAFKEQLSSYQLFYFSFVTLTTVGYGDILPAHRTTMMMSNLEAIIGQLYPAIIIAKLVSIYVVQKLEDPK
ncbi:MAG: potassium channel family protein [Snowella sp.]|nr:potassium channel family protein [Snowella sp.]